MPPDDKKPKITEQPVVVFLAAIVSAFTAGIAAYMSFIDQIEEKATKAAEDKVEQIEKNVTKAAEDAAEEKVAALVDEGKLKGKDGQNGSPGDKFQTGSIISFFGNEAPDGWLICDGTSFARDQYPKLYDHLVTLNKALFHDSPSVGKLPNLQGVFLRGLDPKEKYDLDGEDRFIGHLQKMSTQEHRHPEVLPIPPGGNPAHIASGGVSGAHKSFGTGNNDGPLQTGIYGDYETRPINVAVNFIIKY